MARRLHAGCAAEFPRPPPALRQLAHRGDVQGVGSRPRPTLFALNYEPLLRAINHVLFVSKMADATAAEVAASVSRYDQARQSLAGYQIVLDFLVARHFGLPEAAHLVQLRQPSGPDRPAAVSMPHCTMTRSGNWSPRSRRWPSAPTGAFSIGRSSFPKCSSASSTPTSGRSGTRTGCRRARRGSTAWWGIRRMMN